MELIQLQRVSFSYPQSGPVFERFDWGVESGEAWSVLGPSGCGKTTLLYLLAGLRMPDAGEIRLHGERLHRPRPRTGLILQDYGLLPWATVQENAGLGLRMRRFYGPDEVHAPADDPVADIDLRVDHWIDRLGLSDARHQFPSQLSGGQRQRTAIARTLVMQPDLLLMDEPFASLDAPTRASLQDLVWVLRREHDLTTIIVTHTIEEAALLGNHILLLKNPPTTKAVIVANTEAGTPGFGESDAYKAVCGQLYKRMGEQA